MRKLMNVMLVLTIMFITNMIGIHANDGNPIDIKITTDKQNYKAGDDIKIHIQIENTSKGNGKSLDIKYIIPEGILIEQIDGNHDKNSIIWQVDHIGSKEKIDYEIMGKTEKDISADKIVNNVNSNEKNISTGDDTNILALCILFGAGFIIIISFKKKKNIGKFLLISGITLSSIPIQKIQGEELLNQYESSHIVKVDNKELKGKVIVSVIFEEIITGDIPGSITLDNEVNEYNVVTFDQDEVSLTGKAVDRNGIDRIEYTSYSVTGVQKQGVANGKEVWSIPLTAEYGTSNVTVSCIDVLGNKTSITFKVNHITNEIQLSDHVVNLDEKLKQLFSEELCDVIQRPDNVVDLIFNKKSKFVEMVKNKEHGLEMQKVLYIEPDDVFLTGFTKKIDVMNTCDNLDIPEDHIFPSDITAYTNEYTYIRFREPLISELYKSDVSIDFSNMYIDENEPVAFIAYADGTAVQGNTNITVKENRSLEKGFQIDSLKKIFKIKNQKYNNGKGVKKLGLDFKDVIIYDADGDKDTSNDQLTLSGECGLDNIKIGGGLEWHPSLTDLLPQQIKYEMKFDQINNISAKFGMDFDSKDFVKNANKSLGFTNETKGILDLIDISGVKLENRIYLGTVGVNVFTGAIEYGTLGSISKIDKSIMIPLNFFIDIDVKGKINFTLETGYNSYNRLGFNIQKDGFEGSYGSVESNKSSSMHKQIANYSLDLYNESTKSKGVKEKPEAYLKGDIEGSIKARIGAGLDSGIMILGIMPATAGVAVSVNAEADGKMTGILYSDSEPEVDIAGKVDITGTLDGMFDLRLAINNHELFSHSGRLTLWKFFDKHFEVYKGVKGTVYIEDKKDEENKKTLSEVKITYKNKLTGKIYEMYSNKDGIYTDENLSAGDYDVIAYKDGYVVNTFETRIGAVNMTPIDIYMSPLTYENATGSVYANVPDNFLYPTHQVANATIKIYKNDILIKTIYSNDEGYYSVGDLPLGKYEIIAEKSGYKCDKSAFEYDQYNMKQSIHMEKLADIIMKKGDTYRFVGVGNSPRIYANGDAKINAADYRDNLRTAIVGGTMTSGWIPIDKNKNYDITVLEGESSIYMTEEGTRDEIKVEKIDHEALKLYTLTSGQALTIQADSSLGIWGYRPITHRLVEGNAILTDYYNTTEAKDSILEIGKTGTTSVWGLGSLSTIHYQVTEGTLIVALRYDDIPKLHIK